MNRIHQDECKFELPYQHELDIILKDAFDRQVVTDKQYTSQNELDYDSDQNNLSKHKLFSIFIL